MREINHENLQYQGAPNEGAVISVTPTGTTQMATCTVDGVSKPLNANDQITFDLKSASGQQTTVQLILDFDAEGSYEVAVENIPNCSQDTQHTGRCVNVFDGPPKEFPVLVFSVA